MVKLMKLFKNSLPVETLVVWTTVPPISTTCYGPLLVKQVSSYVKLCCGGSVKCSVIKQGRFIIHNFASWHLCQKPHVFVGYGIMMGKKICLKIMF
jgi:hypothetical protein